MPREGYRTLTVREDVRRKLEELRLRLGFSNVNDLLLHLITVYEQFLAVYGTPTGTLTVHTAYGTPQVTQTGTLIETPRGTERGTEYGTHAGTVYGTPSGTPQGTATSTAYGTPTGTLQGTDASGEAYGTPRVTPQVTPQGTPTGTALEKGAQRSSSLDTFAKRRI